MKKGTSRHPKTKKFAVLLGVSRHHATGILIDLWEFADTYAPDRRICKYQNAEIAEGIDYDGDADRLIDSLENSRWVKGGVIDDAIGRRPDLGSAEWVRIRREVIAEQGAVCSYCKEDCAGDPTVDHIKPFSRGGTIDKSNLTVACRSCNSRKSDKEGWAHPDGN